MAEQPQSNVHRGATSDAIVGQKYICISACSGTIFFERESGVSSYFIPYILTKVCMFTRTYLPRWLGISAPALRVYITFFLLSFLGRINQSTRYMPLLHTQYIYMHVFALTHIQQYFVTGSVLLWGLVRRVTREFSYAVE